MCVTAKAGKLTPLRLPVLWLLLSIFVSNSASAVDPNNHISQYAHTAWRLQDGIFDGTPRVLAQTADGYLWIGTMSGLVRFDGVRFVPWDPPNGEKLPSQRINSLLGGTDGSLWIGTAVGLSLWKNNHLTNYPDQRGVVTAIFEDTDSTIWINVSLSASKTPLCKIDSTGMRCFGASDGIPPGAYWALAKDHQGNFWIGREQGLGLVRWKPDSHETYGLKGPKNTEADVTSIAVQSDGSLWAGIDVLGPGLGLQRFVHGVWKPFLTPELDGSKVAVLALLLDRENALWVGTAKNGVYRIYRDKVEHFGSTDGLSSDYVYKLFEDREGNVWAATSKGIDNFRDLRIVSFSMSEGLSTEEVDSVFASRDGGIWIGGPSSMDLLRDGHISYVLAERKLSGGATSFFEDHANRLWVGIDNTLRVYENGKFRLITSKKGGPIGMVYSITEDTDHNIWVESSGPLSRIRDFKVEEEFSSRQIPAAFRVVADPKSGIWLGLINGDLARHQDGQTETFHFEHAQKSRVEQVVVNPDGSVLGATAHGLIGWREGRQLTLTPQNGLPCEITYASIFDAQGDLWIYAQCGLIKITKEELQNWWDHPDAKVEPRVFDAFDGAQPGRAPFGGATRSPDGRLWFASGVVLQTIDPDHLALNPLPPPVHIEGIVADHRNYLPRGGLRLPALTRDVEVDYTALSFVAPKKVRFRYKLVGRDTSWQDPGIRRQAFYTDLRPGKYTFQVIACNNDGVWNEEGATLEFGIAPAWFQTNWFLLLSLVSGILFSLVLYRLRVGQIARTMSARFDERLAERTRLAREIHDTLLQTIQGSKMVADDALDESSDLPRMRRAMERLSGWLGQATQEGRAALNSLRNSTTQTNDLAEAFQRALDDCRMQGFPEAVFVVEGTAAEMHPIVRDEIYRIGYEAIRNASQHSEASHLTVRLLYSQNLVLTISDDGKGIDPEIASRGKDGHFGLAGMRERAHRIGAKFNLTSSPDSGTRIELTVPGRIIFRNTRPTWRTLFTTVSGTHPRDGAS